MRLVVEYPGWPSETDALIEHCAQVGKAVWDGSGFCFVSGTRDVSLFCKNKVHAEYVAGILKGNLPSNATITFWE
jgi:hypothetical protein